MSNKETNIANTETVKQENINALIDASLTAKAAEAVQMPVHKAIIDGIKQEQNKLAHLPGKTRRRIEKKERREAQAGNAWDEVNAIAMACHNMLTLPASLLPMLREKKVLEKVKDVKQLIRLVDSITADCRTLQTDYKKITEQHAGKEGPFKSDEDMMLAYSVFTDYVNFTELTNSCLVPSLAWVSEIIAEALNVLSKEDPEMVARLNYESVNGVFLGARKAMDGITGAGDGVTESDKVH